MLKPVVGLHGPKDFRGFGPYLALGPLVLIGFKLTSRNLVFCLLGIAVGVWYDDGDD